MDRLGPGPALHQSRESCQVQDRRPGRFCGAQCPWWPAPAGDDMSDRSAARPALLADDSARPALEVRAPDGFLLKRISVGAAEQLVALGWAEWIHARRRRYARLTPSAPLSALHSVRGRDGARPIRASGALERAAGQVLGDSAAHREFAPFYG